MIQLAFKYSKSLLFFFIVSITFWGNNSFGQEDKKSLSLSLQYVKIMNENSFLDITTKFKGKEGFEPGRNLILTIYKTDTTGVVPDIKLGLAKTNKVGKGKFIIPSKTVSPSASYTVKLENDKTFEDTEENVIVSDASIKASIEKINGVNTIKAKLISSNDEPIAGESIKVGLKRLFGNLPIGKEESYTTDEDGTILVPIDKGLTGIGGKLKFQTSIEESDNYGTVIANINANFGVPIVDKSTFNQRTMWSPPTKAPLLLLIIPNIILIGIWSVLVLLLINLFKIYKSKN